jgi:Resolvase, N terminal domain
MVARPRFEKLVAALCAGEIGAVLCFDASRLARNGRDWHHLLELCGLVEARVIDLDGVYDPCRPNDRLARSACPTARQRAPEPVAGGGGLFFPRPSDGRRLTSFDWTPIRYRNVIGLLKNPFYAGAYVYGKAGSGSRWSTGGRANPTAMENRPRTGTF